MEHEAVVAGTGREGVLSTNRKTATSTDSPVLRRQSWGKGALDQLNRPRTVQKATKTFTIGVTRRFSGLIAAFEMRKFYAG